LADFDWQDWQQKKKKINKFLDIQISDPNSLKPVNENTELEEAKKLLIVPD
tara:strand:+ start:1193 stop:1345 length:153 start_codon:yes stop_codon:yes gene_type:complete